MPAPPAPNPPVVFADGDDGDPISDLDVAGANFEDARRGIFALENADLFNLLCIPPFSDTDDVDAATWDQAVAYATRRRAMVIVDPPLAWNDAADAVAGVASFITRSPNAALYFPRIRAADPCGRTSCATSRRPARWPG